MPREKSPIWIGAIAWKDFKDHILQVNDVEDVLNNQIDLEEYGEGLISFNYIPMVLRPTNRIHEEEISYSSRKKELNIHLKMDYQEVINAGVDGFLPLVGQLLLEGIERAPQDRIKDFDWKRFKKDITNLLAENGWLLPAEQV